MTLTKFASSVGGDATVEVLCIEINVSGSQGQVKDIQVPNMAACLMKSDAELRDCADLIGDAQSRARISPTTNLFVG